MIKINLNYIIPTQPPLRVVELALPARPAPLVHLAHVVGPVTVVVPKSMGHSREQQTRDDAMPRHSVYRLSMSYSQVHLCVFLPSFTCVLLRDRSSDV